MSRPVRGPDGVLNDDETVMGQAGHNRLRLTHDMPDDWPFLGRADDLDVLCDRMVDGSSRAAVVAGPAGVGKTRLALEVLAYARMSGMASASVTATSAAARVPFGALAPLLGNSMVGPGPVGQRANLLHRVANAIMERFDSSPRLALLVDDAHLLDDLSAAVIHLLAETRPVFILAALRSGVTAPDPIVALWKDGLAERLELKGLESETLTELLESTLPGPVDPAAAAELVLRCRGNVLFFRELVLSALQAGVLRDDGGIWRIVGTFSPSDRLVELVEQRLADLTPAERRLLELASFGEPLGRMELSLLSSPDLAESLERKRLLATQLEGRRLTVRVAHPVYGDVLRAQTPAIRIAALTGSLAEAVESTGGRRADDVLRIGTWRLESGGAPAPVMLAAARAARWRYDFGLAKRLAQAAIDAGGGFDAGLLAAQLTSLQGRCAQADTELAQLTEQAETDAQRGELMVNRFDNSVIYLGHLADGIEMAKTAEAAIADPGWRDEVQSRRATMTLGAHGPRAAAEAVEPLLARATGRALGWACVTASWSLTRLGRFEEARATAERGYAVQLRLPESSEWVPDYALFARCEALAGAGRLIEADALATEHYQRSLEERSADAQAVFAWYLAKVVEVRGQVKTSIAHAREAVALFRSLGRSTYVQGALTAETIALALAGRAREATAALADLDALGLDDTFYWPCDPIVARAWTAAAGGDVPTAGRLFAEAARLGERVGDGMGRAAALHGLVRIGHPKEAAAELTELVGVVEGELTEIRAAHALALARGDGELLVGVSHRFEDLGAELLAAESAADAAVSWRKKQDPRAAAAATRAALLMARCEGAVTPALRGLGGRARLTPTERDTALLAASGRSNKEIAEDMYVSLRTVENRLQRVYGKLGISNRARLAELPELLDLPASDA